MVVKVVAQVVAKVAEKVVGLSVQVVLPRRKGLLLPDLGEVLAGAALA